MRAIIVCGFVLVSAAAQTPAEKLWTELNEKRDKLPGIHQEITVSRTYKTANGDQSSKWEIILDMAHGQWREESISGSGKHLRIFDGKDLFSMEEGGEEFTRLKRRPKDPDPVPAAYRSKDAEWSKIAEVERIRCGISGQSHECVVLDVPLKPWARSSRPVQVAISGPARSKRAFDVACTENQETACRKTRAGI
jgi:hypothetical protein